MFIVNYQHCIDRAPATVLKGLFLSIHKHGNTTHIRCIIPDDLVGVLRLASRLGKILRLASLAQNDTGWIHSE